MADPSKNISAWLKSVGMFWDESLVDLRPVGGGLGVIAVRDLCEGQKLCEIPKRAVLSIRNTGISELLEQHMIRGGLGLIVAIMYELSLGKKSLWHGYLTELQQREYLPLFWAEEERSLLQGTEAEHRPQEDKELTQEDFETHVLPLVEQHPDQLKADAFTLDTFRVAASWVASRAFGVDSFHGMSMVPLADIFNHKAAIVQLSDEYMIEPACYEEDDSSEEGDSLASDAEASGNREEADDVPEQNGEGHAVRRREEERAAPAETRGSMLKMSGGSLGQYRLEIGICGATRSDGEEVLEIIAASPVPKGQEVHNTYGELGNAELIVKYGFALRQNPFDAVVLYKDQVVAEARRIVGERGSRQRCRFLSCESELLEEDREPFEVLPDGHIGPSLLAALRVLLAADSEFLRWRSLDDALQLCASQQQPECSADRPDEAASARDAAEQPALGADHRSEDGKGSNPSRKRVAKKGAAVGSGQVLEGSGLKKHCCEGGREAGTADVPGNPAACTHSDSCCAQHNGDCEANGDKDRQAAAGRVPNTLEKQQLQIGNTSILTARSCGTLTANMCLAFTRCIQLRLQRYRHAGLAEDLKQLEVEEGVDQKRRGRSESSRARLAAMRLVVGEKELLHAALTALQ